jgi:hypothetical protein
VQHLFNRSLCYVPTADWLKVAVFWFVAVCSLVEVHGPFIGAAVPNIMAIVAQQPAKKPCSFSPP